MVDSPTTPIQPSSSSSFTKAELKTTSFSFFFFFFTSSKKKTTAFAYGFMFAFLAFTIFLVFYPPWYSSPPFKKILHSSPSSSYRSHFSSIFSHLLPNSSHQGILRTHDAFNTTFQLSRKNPFPGKIEGIDGSSESLSGADRNGSSNGSLSSFPDVPRFSQGNGNLKGNNTLSASSPSVHVPILSLSQESNQTENWNRSSQSSLKDTHSGKNILGLENNEQDGFRKNTVSLGEKQGKQREPELMNACDIFDGMWVRDDANYPLYPPGSCPHIDQSFNCFLNNRPDNGYEKYRWQPKGCNIPRLNGQDMLELLRGKRLVFVGDSLNRNMWESLVCVLRNSVEDSSRVFEASGRREFRTEDSYSFIFKDYNCSVEFFRSPFLVQEWEIPNMGGSKKETLRLDVTERSLDKYISADILVFNTGHWWTHEKTAKGKGYYQEGNHVYGELNVKVAFRKALTTWARWVDANIDPRKTLVFFRGYSSSHFRAGRWNSGGQCDGEIEPIMNKAYLGKYPAKMRILESIIKGMKTPVFYLNITRMTEFRKDAHPSFYRKKNLTEEEKKLQMRHQDCSHWCLPGVPDTWNELLYAQLLVLQQKQQR